MAHDIYAISMSGMAIERAKLEAASMNIANANTVSSTPEGVYKVKQLSGAANNLSFAERVELQSDQLITQAALVQAQYKPEHAMANDQGYVFTPQINLATEMLNLNTATRAYEANVKAFNAYKSMSSKALEIGK
ncbi:flagellar basal body rod protein FlgC [Pseudoalteromonas byunsanensis]|uniref:Uncharacterized protein n=1 Tax=Pseudoalteromonas byunsanensis TaxID=327939 RepID=A0A1S1ND21_9GAMM|nr:flagellar basal body rod C-terminal domain-containing protein [Pseudoalteromonas byunsanensis]OHU97336.1 hypothetical protein BIW53_03165 [Pseudoalteromonas byunsanensis]